MILVWRTWMIRRDVSNLRILAMWLFRFLLLSNRFGIGLGMSRRWRRLRIFMSGMWLIGRGLLTCRMGLVSLVRVVVIGLLRLFRGSGTFWVVALLWLFLVRWFRRLRMRLACLRLCRPRCRLNDYRGRRLCGCGCWSGLRVVRMRLLCVRWLTVLLSMARSLRMLVWLVLRLGRLRLAVRMFMLMRAALGSGTLWFCRLRWRIMERLVFILMVG